MSKEKTGGRQAGTKNKKTLAKKEELEAMFNDRLGFDALFDAIDIIEDPKDKAASIMKIMEFFTPKLKAIDHTTGGETFQGATTVVFTATGVPPIESESDIDDS